MDIYGVERKRDTISCDILFNHEKSIRFKANLHNYILISDGLVTKSMHIATLMNSMFYRKDGGNAIFKEDIAFKTYNL